MSTRALMAEMQHWKKSFVLVCSVFAGVVCKDEGKQNLCVDARSTSGIGLHCPGSSVIYQPEVFAYADRRCSDNVCYGHPPAMLVELNQCYWRKTCNVSMSEKIILSGKNCGYALNRPKAMKFVGGYCVDEKNIIDICDRNTTAISSETFILRSHPEYPWLYNRDMFIPKGKSIESRNECRKVFQPLNTWEQLVINITAFDIGEETDYLEIRTRSRTINVTEHDVSQPILLDLKSPELHAVTFRFHYNVPVDTIDDTKGGSGFIICAKAFDRTMVPNNLPSICGDIMKRDIIADTLKSPKGNHQKGGNRQRPGKGKRKKGRRRRKDKNRKKGRKQRNKQRNPRKNRRRNGGNKKNKRRRGRRNKGGHRASAANTTPPTS